MGSTPEEHPRRFRWPSNRQLALTGFVTVSALLLGIVVWETRVTLRRSSGIYERVSPFTAEVTTTAGASIARSRLAWRDPRNWRFDTFDPADPARIIHSQQVESGRLVIRSADGSETHFSEALDRVPGEWFITPATALGRGGTRTGENTLLVRQTRLRPCDDLAAPSCEGRTLVEETVEHEYQPDTGIPVRYTVIVDGEVVKDVRLSNIEPA